MKPEPYHHNGAIYDSLDECISYMTKQHKHTIRVSVESARKNYVTVRVMRFTLVKLVGGSIDIPKHIAMKYMNPSTRVNVEMFEVIKYHKEEDATPEQYRQFNTYCQKLTTSNHVLHTANQEETEFMRMLHSYNSNATYDITYTPFKISK